MATSMLERAELVVPQRRPRLWPPLVRVSLRHAAPDSVPLALAFGCCSSDPPLVGPTVPGECPSAETPLIVDRGASGRRTHSIVAADAGSPARETGEVHTQRTLNATRKQSPASPPDAPEPLSSPTRTVSDPSWMPPASSISPSSPPTSPTGFVRGLRFTDYMLRELDDVARANALYQLRATIDANQTRKACSTRPRCGSSPPTGPDQTTALTRTSSRTGPLGRERHTTRLTAGSTRPASAVLSRPCRGSRPVRSDPGGPGP